mmetsp:Transcript_19423/g.58686  ORF Transcript_19423/g.58686 Transcript_19423/m.58686 type:complete len:272 (+) Transcript_19423:317-1132(+)
MVTWFCSSVSQAKSCHWNLLQTISPENCTNTPVRPRCIATQRWETGLSTQANQTQLDSEALQAGLLLAVSRVRHPACRLPPIHGMIQYPTLPQFETAFRRASAARGTCSLLTSRCHTALMPSLKAQTRTPLSCRRLTTSARGGAIAVRRKMTMLESTAYMSTTTPSMLAIALAKALALEWSLASSGGTSLRATSPIAARTPPCRSPPPSILRRRCARLTNAAGPTMTLPTGAPNPLDRQKVADVTRSMTSLMGTPRAAAALKARAPSRCTG